ncbi:MAG: hypothetical protein K8R74_14370, partial [Bacteroidales bacterium]|nr:hypothetical protein [Bacteroidales bacterium]
MKHLKIYLWIVILVLGLQSFAQNEKISVGIKLLPGISKSVGLIETNLKFSMGGGVQFVANFNKVIGIESGIYYRNLGYNSEETWVDSHGSNL